MARSRQKRSKVAPPPEAMSHGGDDGSMMRSGGVGATLRDERLRRGWDLADVAEYLKIRRVHLDAIEADRFDEIPSGTYAVNFVRSYSEALGLDATEMVRRFREQLAGGTTRRLELHFPQPLPESRLPGGVIILVSVAIAALGYGAWISFSQDQRETLARVDPVPQQMQAVVPPPAAPAPNPTTIAPGSPVPVAPNGAAPAASSAIAGTPAAPASATPAPAAVVPPSATPPRPTSSAAQTPIPVAPPAPPPAPQDALAALQPPAPAVVAPPEGPSPPSGAPVTENPNGTRVFGEPGSSTRVVITAQADSWVQVRDAGGAILFMRILKAGDAYHVPNRAGLMLTTGSAGSIDIKVDGKPAPSLGRVGFVRRDVPLEPERLMSGAGGAAEPVRPPAAARGNGG